MRSPIGLSLTLSLVSLVDALFVGGVGYLIDCALPEPTTRGAQLLRRVARRALLCVVAAGLVLGCAGLLSAL